MILQPDMLSVNAIASQVTAVVPRARCHPTSRLEQTMHFLAANPVDLLVTTLDVNCGDVLDLLVRSRGTPWRAGQVMVTTARLMPRVVLTLRSLAVPGAFDVDGGSPVELQEAIGRVVAGKTYWSRTLLDALIAPSTRKLNSQLTPAEQLGLAVLGDGCGDHTAARLLGMQHSSVRSLRKRIHAKLGAHDKEDMMRMAARLGYTRFSANGVVPLGLGMLALEYLRDTQRPMPLSDELMRVCGLTAENIRHDLLGARPSQIAQ